MAMEPVVILLGCPSPGVDCESYPCGAVHGGGNHRARLTREDPVLITHELPLERINEGFELVERGESTRSVIVY